MHADPIAAVALHLAVILVAAKLGGELAVRLRQPAVLGEILAGIVVGNLGPAGFRAFDGIASDPTIDALARLGVLVLLFEVGLESTVRDMVQVGASSLLVAILGVIAPFGLGWLVGLWLVPQGGPYVHAFLGATLTATSVGITARVLQDLGRSRSAEARIILGAAVIDDVLGLVVLAVVTGVIGAADRGSSLSVAAVAAIVGKALGFLAGALAIGTAVSRPVFRIGSRFRGSGMLLALGLSFCLALSWLAAEIGLAPIVGAFAAGLVLEDVHFRDYTGRGERGLEELIHPISSFLVPVFFVVMGARTSLASLSSGPVLILAAVLVLAAVLGKQACSLGVLEKGLDRLTVGLGMIPRGEVGLIFANIGVGLSFAGKPVLDATTYSAVVVVVVVTTLVTPPALRWSTGRRAAPGDGPVASP